MKEIPVFKPLIEKDDISSAVESLELGWLGMGSYVNEFEKQVEKVCSLNGDRHAVAVSTGHAALHLSLLMMGVGIGDEVITPSFNNTADFQAIRACGADPVFVDILEDTLCIDPSKIEELITEKTKCIIVMDYDIFIADHDAITIISNKYNIPVLHDAAHSFGSSYNGMQIGNQHPYTIFSFDPVKTITCIDGGAIIVDSEDKVKQLHSMRLIGMTQPASQMYTNARAWTYDVENIGFRYHMANLHAAIGISQIQKIETISTSRQKTCNYYYKNLSSLDWLDAPYADFSSITPFLYYVRVKNGKRTELRNHMYKYGVDTGIHWQAGHKFSYFSNCRHGDLSVTELIVDEILSIPLHSNMKNSDAECVVQSMESF